MKNSLRSIYKIGMIALLVAALTVACASCGAKSVQVETVYSVNPSSEGTAKYRTVPMGMVETNGETITVFDDGTYCLAVTTTIITNMKAITEGNDEVINRGTTIVSYFGAFTLTEDSGLTMLKLSKPTRLTIANSGSLLTGGFPVGYFDTDSWSDAVTESMTEWAGSYLGEGVTPTAEALLNRFAFSETEVIISEDGLFDYLKLSYHNIILGF